ncbi:hypothetical protein BLL41_21370 [Bacillus sp. FMQ74]|uniref:hypothetical protein n=1 Tax=Bacillus TaxID=1386 RepID=UPI0008FB03AC|nr:hypothetical protein [Bacillus sp. FMQ74]OIR59260.1 hypothetical protein BLL41_21370 [Bacillus sp. FMQ74]
MKHILSLMVEKKRLEDQYGWRSCFDVPEQYDKMENLSVEIMNNLKEYEKHHADILASNLYDVLDTIAFEIVNGNISEEAEVMFYTQDDYLETYVLGNFNEEQMEVFDKLFYYMNSDDRAGWLKSNYINNDPNEYTDNLVNFVVVVIE